MKSLPFFRSLLLLTAGGLGMPAHPAAAPLPSDTASVLAGACVNCHLPGGTTPIPSLKGISEARLRARLTAFHDGTAADATVMTRLMKGYDREQIEALVKWFSAEAGQ